MRSEMCTCTRRADFPQESQLGRHSGRLLCCTPGGIRERKKKSGKGFNGEELDFNLGCHQVYPCASPPHLDGRTRRGEEGACVGKGQTKSDREGKLQGKVSLHPHLEQGGMAPVKKKKKAKAVDATIFSLTDGS